MPNSFYQDFYYIIANIFAIIIIFIILSAVFLYLKDKFQKESSLRRNYPLIARFRYLFETMGEFFRQYFFAQDRQELPFNRAERSWVYRAAKNIDNSVPFGTTKNLNKKGSFFFVTSQFPYIDNTEKTLSKKIIFGEYTKNPYSTDKFFHIAPMSFGAISKPAVIALSKGANLANILMSTGEGGLSPYHLEGKGDLIFQIGTAKYGVRTKDGKYDESRLKEISMIDSIKMFEIKLSQGAKPGKGGLLPAAKVTPEIAEIRKIEAWTDSISPNGHTEIRSVSDIIESVNFVRNIVEKPVGIKFTVGDLQFVKDLCNEIKKRGLNYAPDYFLIDSAEGGTGAAPMSFLDNMGMTIFESLPYVVDIVKSFDLKERIKILASGKLMTPSDVAWALAVGADMVFNGRGFLFSLGCIQALRCNKNTCPTGITTHDINLQHGLDPILKSVRVANYAKNIHKEVTDIAHACGVGFVDNLKRDHLRYIIKQGKSVSFSEYYN